MQGEASRIGLAHQLAEHPGTKIGTYVGAVLMGTKLRMWLPTGGGEDAKRVVEVLGLRGGISGTMGGLGREGNFGLGVDSGGAGGGKVGGWLNWSR